MRYGSTYLLFETDSKMKYLTLAVCISLAALVHGQYDPGTTRPDVAEALAEFIQPGGIEQHLRTLASDAFEGRETGTPGIEKAAAYIAAQFQAHGIPPVPRINGYFQEVAFSTISLKESLLQVDGVVFSHLRDFIVAPLSMPRDEIVYEGDEVVFLGYGIDAPAYSDYQGARVEGRAILIYTGEPVDSRGISKVTGTTQRSEWSADLTLKLQTAARHGVAVVFVIDDRFRERAGEMRRFILAGQTVMGIPESVRDDVTPHVYLSSMVAEAMMGNRSRRVIRVRDRMREKGRSRPVSLSTAVSLHAMRRIQSTPGANVLGYIEGTDPAVRDEVIVISAHYDHLGKRGDDIYYGADDNASGTSAVISIAGALAEAKRQGIGPRRSVLCILMTGEEKGLLGSEYYAQFPVFPLENTVANINIDMIGRTDDRHDDPHYVYVIGAGRLSAELHEINERMNAQHTQLLLDYTYDADDDPNRFYYRSDHYNFARRGVPAVFYFSGVHEDYHRPTDTPDKIMYDKTAVIARLAFHVAWELAMRDERIRVDRS